MALEDVCRQIFEKYSAMGDVINRTKNATQDAINDLESAVADLLTIPQVDLDNLLGDLDNIDTSLPVTLGSVEKDVLKCLMDTIKPGFDTSKIDDATDWTDLPVNLLQGYLDQIVGGINDALASVLDVNPLGQAGSLLGELDGVIQSTGLSDILDMLDSLLACLNAGCSALYPGIPDYANDLRSSLGLSGSNGFDTSVFSTWNSDPAVVTQLNQVTDKVRSVNSTKNSLTLPGL